MFKKRERERDFRALPRKQLFNYLWGWNNVDFHVHVISLERHEGRRLGVSGDNDDAALGVNSADEDRLLSVDEDGSILEAVLRLDRALLGFTAGGDVHGQGKAARDDTNLVHPCSARAHLMDVGGDRVNVETGGEGSGVSSIDDQIRISDDAVHLADNTSHVEVLAPVL